MIITRKKTFSEILDFLKDAKSVFLAGCSLCATTCKTGGEKEVLAVHEALLKEGKVVTGWMVPDPACSLLALRRFAREKKNEITEADAILSLACGGGTQAIAEVLPDKKVYPANDTLFQGEITEITLKGAKFDQKCSMCGECMLAATAGICPVTRCSKGLRNGPCGGTKNGKCEVDRNTDCAWLMIYDRLKKNGKIENMKKTRPAMDHSAKRAPGRHVA